MHTIYDVAQAILQKQGPMTTMKLQKLLYYTQAWSLVWDEAPLFDEDFEAWANGPVYPHMYDWRDPDDVVEVSDVLSAPSEWFSGELFDTDQDDTVNAILRDYGDREADWLSELTHMEDPWRKARGDHAPGDYCHTVITKESMKSYYDRISYQEEIRYD